ncbi:hypothetical protein L596_004928 [Steinernema carpocapsae]|uniref:Uncharacterized protein n=1 Tax=Steinernema carpocapsae TaxID=34508 RepID=A0A4U8V0X6_STECR|nr:hypothetical protein L596_004928 [Steinernema carpocapsae]
MEGSLLNLSGTTTEHSPSHDVVSSLLGANETLSDPENNSTLTTILTTISSTVSSTVSSTQAATASSSASASSTAADILSSISSKTEHQNSPFGMIFISTILFIVAFLLVGKIVYSYRWKRKTQMLGSARWLPTSGSNVNAGTRRGGGGAVYSAMPVNMMETPRPESRLDWERQFFEDDVLNGGNNEEQSTFSVNDDSFSTPARFSLNEAYRNQFIYAVNAFISPHTSQSGLLYLFDVSVYIFVRPPFKCTHNSVNPLAFSPCCLIRSLHFQQHSAQLRLWSIMASTHAYLYISSLLIIPSTI